MLVASGTYSGPLNRDISFGGKDVYLVSEAGADFTIIDCENAGRGFEFTRSETPDAVVEGFTVMNGIAPVNDVGQRWDGALFCDVLEGDYYLCDNSPCLAANHPLGGFALGAHASPYTTCGACAAPVQDVSWGSIKAMYR